MRAYWVRHASQALGIVAAFLGRNLKYLDFLSIKGAKDQRLKSRSK